MAYFKDLIDTHNIRATSSTKFKVSLYISSDIYFCSLAKYTKYFVSFNEPNEINKNLRNSF